MQNAESHFFLSPRGRMAPSPTGYMHLGNAWSFLMAWLSARQQRGSMVLRMEDIDPDRAKPCFSDSIMYDLEWLGLTWDEGPYTQSQCSEFYIAALKYFDDQGHSYPCFCTRKELRAMAGAPHLGEACAYAGTCRNLTKTEQNQRRAQGRKACIRLRCPDDIVPFLDRRCGLQEISLTSCGGDFAIQRSDGVFAYQLAVVIDDMRMGITEIVRGDDLLHCTPRQLYLQSLLRHSGLAFLAPYADAPPPSYLHLPLLLDAEGERFAKRHASLTIQSLRSAGIPASCVLGYIAYLAGFIEKYEPLSAEELIPLFTIQCLPKSSLRLIHDPFQVMKSLAQRTLCNMPRIALACEPCAPVLTSLE